MKKLIALATTAAALCAAADIRLADYPQVAGVSNQVMAVDAKLTATALDVAALKSIVVGGEAASPYLGGIRATFNIGPYAYVPQGEDYVKAVTGAHLVIQLPNQRYSVPVTDISAGAVKQAFIPCQDFVDVDISLVTGPAKHLYSSGSQTIHVHQGEMTDVVIDTLPPLAPPSSQAEELRQFGRAQYYDPDNTYGKRNSGDSFAVQRVWNTNTLEWVTQFGFYSNSVWVTTCDVYNEIPQLDTSGGVVNSPELTSPDGLFAHAYESRAFPWKDARRVAVVLDPAMLNASAHANNATNLFYFSRVPIYVYKETIETLTITNFSAAGAVSSATAYPMQIHWICHPSITNGYDAAYSIPSWEKVYARDLDDTTGTWSTRTVGVKEANYYACYKTAPTYAPADSYKLWRMAGAKRVTQSFPYPNRDNSNYGVASLTRNEMHAASTNLNAFALSIHALAADGVSVGAQLAAFPAPSGDMATRRWAGNNWHDYRAFMELAYIQFGANVQSSANEIANGLPRCVGIVGNNTTSVAQSLQSALETYFAAQPNLSTFTIAPRASNGFAFAWLGILNFWGSEGDQMADVTTVAQSDADGTKSIWYLANLDHSRLIPDSSGTATSYDSFIARGYEKLSYYWAYTGLSGSFYRGKDAKADYAAFALVRSTPASAIDDFAVNLSSSAYDGNYAPSSYPAIPAAGSAFSYWMCSLSYFRSYALGPFYVFSYGGPASAYGGNWGARASLNLLGAEREAQSD